MVRQSTCDGEFILMPSYRFREEVKSAMGVREVFGHDFPHALHRESFVPISRGIWGDF
jgi:hypothetical protein